jgi:hypothetical protein
VPSFVASARRSTSSLEVLGLRLNWRKFWILALVQLIALACWFAPWFYLRASTYLAHPTDGDLYAHTWRFQIMVGLLYFLGDVVLLGVLLGIEAGVSWLLRFATSRARA